jgi:hypothetical protein
MASIVCVMFVAVLLGFLGNGFSPPLHLLTPAYASPSTACGQWQHNCTLDPLTGTFVSTMLTLSVSTFPAGNFPTVDYQGTFGPYTHMDYIYASSDCSLGNLVATVWRMGDWLDQGNGGDKGVSCPALAHPTAVA